MSDAITTTFLRAKDTRDEAWYIVHSFEAVDTLLTVVADIVAPAIDALADYQDLVADNLQVNQTPFRLTTGEVIPAFKGMFFRVLHGKPGSTYALTLQFKTATDGSVLFRKVFLEILGL